MTRMIIFAAIFAAVGGAIGYFGRCSTGTCPFTSTWWGGAVFGGIIGLFLANMLTGAPGTPEDVNNVVDIEGKQAFDSEVASAGGKTVLVDFYLTTCPPCRRLLPEIYELARQYPDELVVLKVNAGKNRELATAYGVSGVPHLVKMKSGSASDKKVGYLSRADLERWLFGP